MTDDIAQRYAGKWKRGTQVFFQSQEAKYRRRRRIVALVYLGVLVGAVFAVAISRGVDGLVDAALSWTTWFAVALWVPLFYIYYAWGKGDAFGEAARWAGRVEFVIFDTMRGEEE